MSTDFEKMMNDKMEHASVNDVLPDFDKDKIWDELSDRIPKKKKKVIPVWWTHAAAVAVGILIGSFAINMFSNNNDNNATPVITKANTPVQQTIIKTDTVFITNQVKVPVKAKEKIIYKEVQQPETLLAKENTIGKTPIQETKPEIQKPVKEPIVVKTEPKKIKPVHLLDIENEDRRRALYNNDPAEKTRMSFVLLTVPQTVGNTTPNTTPSVLHNIFKKQKND